MCRSTRCAALVGLLLLLALRLAGAQTPAPVMPVDLVAAREHLTELTAPWRFHAGDDPHWAEPAFNDTAWPALDPHSSWRAEGYKEADGFAWLRFAVLVPAHQDTLVLALPNLNRNYQLFADGRQIGQVGRLPPGNAPLAVGAGRLFSVPSNPSAQPRRVVFALRLWAPPQLAILRSAGLFGTAYLGDSADVTQHFETAKEAALLRDGSDYTLAVLFVLAGSGSLLLFLLTRQRPYLWFCLFSGCDAALYPIRLAAAHLAFTFFQRLYLFLFIDVIITASFALFVLGLLDIRFRWLRWFILASFVGDLSILLVIWVHLPVPWANGLYMGTALLYSIPLLGSIAWAWRRRVPDASLLFFAYLDEAFFSTLNNTGKFLGSLHVKVPSIFDLPDVQLTQRPFALDVGGVAHALFLLCITAVLILRFGRTSRDQQRLATALQSAHDVQHGLIPTSLPTFAGLTTSVAYLAAEEVGGDFCQILTRPDGSVLAVIGDVSGKGLQAAMQGTLAVGALRSFADELDPPATVLERLNRVILRTGYSGFITCLCLVLDQGGGLQVANAGHLAPYLNGAELPVDSGLPLGLVADASYTESLFLLPETARLTLLSDGVIEARSRSGELFGFERTASVSQLSAADILEQARNHGQADDITILTLDWQAASVVSAAA